MIWVAAATVLALIEYYLFTVLVGRARIRYGIAAPAVVGHPMFERYYRVQQNTLEQLVIFLPALWLAGALASAFGAAIVGALFIFARALYAVGYIRAPERRGPGAGLSFLTTAVLLLGALYGVIRYIVLRL